MTSVGAKRVGMMAAALYALMATAASAHEPYLKPGSFAPARDHVSIEASLTDGVYFVPDRAIRNAQLQLISPSGARAPIEGAQSFRQVTVVEPTLPEQGTYRITTGERAGRTSRVARVDGVWRVIRPAPQTPAAGQAAPPPATPQATPQAAPQAAPMRRDEDEDAAGPINEADVPRRARIVETQGVQISEVYVTRGAPTPGALAPSGQGFELRPITHPNEIYVDEGFAFEFLLNGQPIRDLHYNIVQAGVLYDEQRVSIEGVADAAGRAQAAFTKPGAYVLEARYPARDETGRTEPAARSYFYTLTFEVTR